MSEPKLPDELRPILAILAIAAVLLAVGGPAAVASYRHAWTVATHYGETNMAPWLPLTTDGMIVAALAVMAYRRWRDQPGGFGPWFAATLGLAATLGANLTAAWIRTPDPQPGDFVVAVWPPIAFALTLELVAMLLRPRRQDVDTTPAAGTHDDPSDQITAERIADLAHEAEEIARHEVDAVFDREHLGPALRVVEESTPPALTEDDRQLTADILENMRAEDTPRPTARQIRDRYRVGPPRAKRISAALDWHLQETNR